MEEALRDKAKRSVHAEQAEAANRRIEERRREKIRDLIRYLPDGDVDEDVVTRMAKAAGASDSEVKREVRDRSRSIRPGRSKSADQPTVPMLGEKQQKDIAELLELVGLPSLYAFLSKDITDSSSAAPADPKQSVKVLTQLVGRRFKEVRENMPPRSPEQDTYKELLGVCRGVFGTQDTKVAYDNYCKARVMEEFHHRLEFIGESNGEAHGGGSGFLERLQVDQILKDAVQHGVEHSAAEAYITEYVVRKKWPIFDVPRRRGSHALKLCGLCGARAFTQKDTNCPECGEAFEQACAFCGSKMPTASIRCRNCERNLADGRYLEKSLAEAGVLVRRGDLKGAWRRVDDCLAVWPDWEPANDQRRLIERARKKHARRRAEVEGLVKSRRLVKASERLDELCADGVEDLEDLRRRVDTGVAQAASLFQRSQELVRSGEQDEVVNQLIAVRAVCVDYEEAECALKAMPPGAPDRVDIRLIAAGTASLTWAHPSRSPHITYQLVRKQGSQPLHPEDGDVVYEGPHPEYADGTLQPGVVFHYGVWAVCGGVASLKPALATPIVHAADVSITRKDAGDGEILLAWDPPAGAASVEVWRFEGRGEADKHKGVAVAVRRNRVVDRGLHNDAWYTYLIVANYREPGASNVLLSSPGVSVALRPVGSCPKCSHPAQSSNDRCANCGCRPADGARLTKLLSRAKELRGKGNPVGAGRALAEILAVWADWKPALAEQQMLEKQRARLALALRPVERLIDERRLHKASRDLDRLIRSQGPIDAAKLRRRIDAGLTNARSEVDEGLRRQRDGDIRGAVSRLLAALEHCADYDPARIALNSLPPPDPPWNLDVQVVGSKAKLRWDHSDEEHYVCYRVVRKREAAPTHIDDGDAVTSDLRTQYCDDAIPEGIGWYYGVFAIRCGLPSKHPAICGPILYAADVRHLRDAPGDGVVGLSWEPPTGIEAVEVWRTEGRQRLEAGTGTLVTASATGVLDRGLRNDSWYTYLVVARFPSPQGGEVLKSHGVARAVLPAGPCPYCEYPRQTANPVCEDCGRAPRDEVEVMALLTRSKDARLEGRLVDARASLEKIADDWREWKPAVGERRLLTLAEAELVAGLKPINELARTRQYEGASRALADLIRNRGRAGIEHFEREIAANVDYAKRAFKHAERLRFDGDLERAVQRYVDALRFCSDFGAAERALAEIPPPPPSALTIVFDGPSAVLSWSAPATPGDIEYRVVRVREPSQSGGDQSDCLVADDIPNASYRERLVPGGVPWRYSVYSKRLGALSRSAATEGPLLRAADIDAECLRTTVGDGEIEVTWRHPEGASDVRVWRTEGDRRPNRNTDPINVEVGRVHDTALTNDVPYTYLIVAQYQDPVDPASQLSANGVTVTVWPQPLPPPVCDLRVVRRNDRLMFNWSVPGRGRVKILQLHNNDEPRAGRIRGGAGPGDREISVDQLGALGVPVPITDSTGTELPSLGAPRTTFVPVTFPAGARSDSAILGNPVTVVRDVVDLKAGRPKKDGSIVLHWHWPEGIKEVAITWRDDRWPPNTASRARVRVRRDPASSSGQWEVNGAPGPLFFCVHAVHGRYFGYGVKCYVKALRPAKFQYRLIQPWYLGRMPIVLVKTLRTGRPHERISSWAKHLPPLVVVWNQERDPETLNDGDRLTRRERNSQLLFGRTLITLPRKSDGYARVFIRSDLAGDFQLEQPMPLAFGEPRGQRLAQRRSNT